MNLGDQIEESGSIKVLCLICKDPVVRSGEKAICEKCAQTIREPSKKWQGYPESNTDQDDIWVALTPVFLK